MEKSCLLSRIQARFCRGCWDAALLYSLQLEQKKSFPPSFSELLLIVRAEEDRQAAKASCMRKHVGPTKQRVQLQSQSSCIFELTENPETQPSAIDDLRKQVASLQSQLTTFMAQNKGLVIEELQGKHRTEC